MNDNEREKNDRMYFKLTIMWLVITIVNLINLIINYCSGEVKKIILSGITFLFCTQILALMYGKALDRK